MDVATKFPNFENEGNSCWLDSCMILISHNETLRKHVNNCKNSQIRKIVNDYHQALGILNTVPQKRNALKNARSILTSLQKATLKYLKEFLKFAKGQFESAMCALLSLILQDKAAIKKHFETSLIWHKQCSNCNSYSTSIIKKKTIVTLAKVVNFNPAAPTTRYTCVCKKEQEMKGEIKEASDCLIFHFENGAGKGDTLPCQFFISTRKYHLTCIIIFQDSKGQGKDHFITWVRQPFVEQWLEFNDMEDSVVYFSEVKPKLKMENIYIAVYEAFDNLGKTKIGTFSNEDILASNKFVETIHLVDDSAPSPGEENILITTHKSLYEQCFNEPPSNAAVNRSLCPENEQFEAAYDPNNIEANYQDQYFRDDPHAGSQEETSTKFKQGKTRNIDEIIKMTSHEFFQQILIREDRINNPSSGSADGEDNIIKATYNSLCKKYWNEPSCSTTSTSLYSGNEQFNSFKTSDDEHYQNANCVSPDVPSRDIINSSLHPGNKQFNSFKTSDDEHCQSANSVSPDVTSSETDKDSYFGDNLHAEPKEENKFWLDDPSKRKVVDDVIEKTFAAFFGQLMYRNAKREAAVDSESSSGNEENIMVATYKYLDRTYFSAERNESPCNSTTSSSHTENEQFNSFKTSDDEHYQGANSVSPDVPPSSRNSSLYPGNQQVYSFKSSDDEHCQNVSVSPDVPSSSRNSSLCPGNKQFNSFKTSDDEHCQSANSVSPDATSSETDKDSYFGDNLHAEPKEENKFWLDDPSKRNVVDDVIEKTFAAFFEQIMYKDTKREAAVDSECSSGNEENMVATYKCLDQTLFRAEKNESPCNSNRNSSSHPENKQFDSTNSASSDSTETDSKNLYLSDDSHVERGKKRRNL